MRPDSETVLDITCYFQNVRGLRTKVDEFFASISDTEFSIVGLVETWLSPDINSSEYFPMSFNVLRSDRRFHEVQLSKGGGALLAVDSNLNIDPVDMSYITNTLVNIDIVGCKCFLNNYYILYIYVTYIPPSISVNELELFLELLGQSVNNHRNVLIMGDFNITHFNNNDIIDTKCQLINDFINFVSLNQVNNVVNVNGRLLDLVFTNIQCKVFHDCLPLVKEDVHHPAIQLALSPNAASFPTFPVNSAGKNYNFRKANYPRLYDALLNTDWSFLNEFSDVNEACDSFYRKLYSLFDLYVPLYSNSKSSYPSWYAPDLKRNLRLKNYYRNRYRRTKNDVYLQDFYRIRTITKTQISECYKNYINAAEQSILTDSKRFWNFVNNKRGNSRIPGKMHINNEEEFSTPQHIVDGFAHYFRSVYVLDDANFTLPNNVFNNLPCVNINQLTETIVRQSISKLKNKLTAGHDLVPSFLVRDCAGVLTAPLLTIFNLSLRTAQFPICWKLGRICPVFKSGDVTNVSNYRPISILPNFAKVLEISVYSYIYQSVKNLLSPYQHGFLEKRSSITNLALITQDLCEALDSKGQVDVVYTDFSRAFDTISHNILLAKLEEFGFSVSLIHFFRTYLIDRSYYVAYGGFRSRPFLAVSGVPQGSNLGPLLFLLFIDGLMNSVDCHKLLYADDLKIYCNINSIADCLHLQSQIDVIVNWCKLSSLKLNANKCKVISFSRKKSPIIFDYTLNNVTLERHFGTKDLGIFFDCELNFSEHINNISKSSSRLLGFIIRNCRHFTNEAALKTLYFSLLRSKMEYGSLIWYPIYENQSLTLESIQRKFLKYLSFKINGIYPGQGCDHELLLSTFGIPSLATRRIMNSIIFLFKLFNNNIDCSLLLERFNIRISNFGSRQTDTFYLRTATTNVLKKSPVYTMSHNFNMISNRCDINHTTVRALKLIVLN